MLTLLIDNYDSYTFLIAQYLWKANGVKPLIIKNNALSIEALKNLPFDNIVISPGPGTPEKEQDVHLSLKVFESFPNTPILGICLGHQCLARYFGGKIIPSPKEMHGKYSEIRLKPSPLFKELPSRISVVRYHSLIVEKSSLPNSLRLIAETTDDFELVMALEHKEKPFYGVQFHPESIGTQYGEQVFKNFRNLSKEWINNSRKPISTAVNKRKLITEKIDWIDSERVFECCFTSYHYSFWLDSSLTGKSARYSFMGIPEYIVQKHGEKVTVKDLNLSPNAKSNFQKTSFFDIIEQALVKNELNCMDNELPFQGGFIGYLGYEGVKHAEVELTKYNTDYPDAIFMWVEKFIAFDHLKHETFLCSIADVESTSQLWFSEIKQQIASKPFSAKLYLFNDAINNNNTDRLQLTASKSKVEYIKDILKIKQYLKRGETYEACLTNEFKVHTELDSFELYRVLRLTNAAPYSAYIHFNDFDILSSSPECFVKIDKKGRVESEPIKGTRPKGVTREETEKIKETLIKSSKDHSELLMIIDLIRNDLSVFCEMGSVRVTDFMKVSEYATLLQLSSVIQGQKTANVSVVEVLKTFFPGGSITGAPKYRTMDILDKLEQRPRGVYTGIIGYLSVDKSAAFNIAIRTMVNDVKTNKIIFGSGGAIVAESDPNEEYKEILLKAYALIRAIYLTKFGKFENYRIECVKEDIYKKETDVMQVMPKCFSKSADLERVFEIDLLQ